MSGEEDSDIMQCSAADFFFDAPAPEPPPPPPPPPRKPVAKPKPGVKAAAKPASAAPPVRAKPAPPPAVKKPVNQRKQFIDSIENLLRKLKGNSKAPTSQALVSALSIMQDKLQFLSLEHSRSFSMLNFNTVIIDDFVEILVNTCDGSLNKEQSEITDQVRNLFEKQLEDKKLAPQAKLLLVQLQLPFLKIGFLNRKLLANKAFPGNRLFEQIVFVGKNATPDAVSKNPVYKECGRLVKTVVENFRSDIKVFTELEKSSAVLKNKTPTAKSNQPKQKVVNDMVAKGMAKAEKVVKKYVRQGRMPTRIHKFLITLWVTVLATAITRHGENSVQYQDGLQFLQELIWLSELVPTAADQRAMKETFIEIWIDLDEGLGLIECSREQKEEVCSMLLDLYVSKMNSI